MFYIQEIHEGDVYCICKGQWKNFVITDIDIFHEQLKVFITPDDGLRCLLLRMDRGAVKPCNIMKTNFSFALRQHVKIEVQGGKICIAGVSYDGLRRVVSINKFTEECPFGDFENEKLSVSSIDEDLKLMDRIIEGSKNSRNSLIHK